MSNEIKNVLTGQPIPQGDLKKIADMGNRLLTMDTEIADMEEKLEQMKEQRKQLAEVTLPDAMMGIGLAAFTLINHRQLLVDKYYSCSLPKAEEMDKRKRAFDWLRLSGNGGIIKTNFIEQFTKGQEEQVAKLAKLLTKNKVDFAQKDDVHHQTLKAFVREEMEKGRNVPAELFNVYVGNRIIIK